MLDGIYIFCVITTEAQLMEDNQGVIAIARSPIAHASISTLTTTTEVFSLFVELYMK